MVGAGLLWLAFALLIGLFLFQSLVGGADIPIFVVIVGVSTMAIVGVFQIVGFAAAASLCFIIGMGLCVYGFTPASKNELSAGGPEDLLTS